MTIEATAPRPRQDASQVRRLLHHLLADVPWYPVLIALTWFLQAYQASHVEPVVALRSLVVVMVVAVAITAVCARLLGTQRGSVLASLVLMGAVVIHDTIVAVLLLAAAALLAIEHHRRLTSPIRYAWRRIHEGLSIAVTVLFLITVGNGLVYAEPSPLLDSQAWSAQPLDAAAPPDMYLVLVDAHGRQDILSDLYGYDDGPFLSTLEDQGFMVASRSRSNYGLTRFSVGSMLTGSYLSPLDAMRDPELQNAFAQSTIAHNPAFPLLRRAGYEVIVVSGGYEHLGLRTTGRFVDTGQLNEFEDALLDHIGATELLDDADPGVRAGAIRGRVLDELTAVHQLAGEAAESPRFVFVHLPIPHGPYVFGADCSPSNEVIVAPEGLGHGGDPTTFAAVAAQTACVDRLLEESVARLVASDPDAVVILFSDHGPDEHLDWSAPDATGLNERSATLFAARTPGQEGVFGDDITLVNVFPDLFNAYLGTQLDRQPNEFWFGPRPADRAFVRVDLQ